MSEEAQKSLTEAVQVILLCHSTPEGRKLLAANHGMQQVLQDNLNAILPILSAQIVGRDRQQIMQAMQQVSQDRKVRNSIGAEKLNLEAYQAVLSDLQAVHTQVRPPQLNLIPAEDSPAPKVSPSRPHDVGLGGVTDVSSLEIGAAAG